MSGTVVCEYQGLAYGITGENATWMHDGKYRADQSKRRIIVARSGHGSDGTGVGPLQGGFFFEITRAFIDAGYDVYCIDAGGPDNWWSPDGITAFTAAINSLKTRFGISKVALYGGSMGGGESIQAVKTLASSLIGVACISAIEDLDYAHGTSGYTTPYTYNHTATPTFGDWTAECETAYHTNAAGWAVAAAGHLIHDEPASWRGLPFPVRLWHGDQDEVVPYAMAQWWVGQVNDAQVTLRTLPGAFHTPAQPSTLGPPTQEYLDFFNGLAWPS